LVGRGRDAAGGQSPRIATDQWRVGGGGVVLKEKKKAEGERA